jgi:hypothetical protein
VSASSTEAPPRPSKIGAVLNLLRREEGATLPELVDATGWLPHTMRAVRGPGNVGAARWPGSRWDGIGVATNPLRDLHSQVD